MTREQIELLCKNIQACTGGWKPEESILLKHDAEQRLVIEQQTQQIATLQEALKWDGLKVSEENMQWALKELGPAGTRAEAYVQAVVEFAIHMRRIAKQQALKEVNP